MPKEIVKPFVSASVITPAPEAAASTPAGGGILSKIVPTVKEMQAEQAAAAPAPAAEPAVSPAVSDPAPVAEAPKATEDMQQTVMRKKKGRKKTILTGSAGLGGDPSTYQSMLS